MFFELFFIYLSTYNCLNPKHMARPKGIRVDNECKTCNKIFQTTPSNSRVFCSGPCAQQYKGIDKSWMDKRRNTCMEKYGVEVAFKSQQVQDLYKKNMMNKHGVSNPFSLKETRDKSKNTTMERFGVEYASQNKGIGDKISKSLKGREIDRNNFVNIKYDKILIYCKEVDMIPLFDMEYLINNKVNHVFNNKFGFKCNKCDEETYVHLGGGYLPTCKCSNYKGYSLIEEEVIRYIGEILNIDEISLNRRDILPNRLELDIYIPTLNIAVEVNGVYWHSESMGKYRDYHLYKTLKCIEKDIHLIHILDYEWLFKKPIIQSILSNKMGVNSNKVYARKCDLGLITDTNIIRSFLDNNHIQGYTHASTSLGLYHNDELISIMTFGKNRFKKNSNELEMVRFCNKLNTTIIGGASKLFIHFVNNYNDSGLDIISFADRRFFDGKLYKMLGFDFEKNTSPSYIYWKNNKILNRMSCQKHKLNKLLESFDPTQTEYENMLNNGFKRVWDCGNIKYVWKKGGISN